MKSYRTLRNIVEQQKILTAAPTKTTIQEATRLMKQTRVGALLVVEHGQLVGIFTERDALVRVLAEGRDPTTTLLSDVMTPDPQTMHPDKPFLEALHLMHEGGFRHVPVTDHGKPLGVVSARDALAMEAAELEASIHQREHLRAVIGY